MGLDLFLSFFDLLRLLELLVLALRFLLGRFQVQNLVIHFLQVLKLL